MSDKNFPWDGFCEVLGKIYISDDIESVVGERIAHSVHGMEVMSSGHLPDGWHAVSIAVMDATVFSLPIATIEGEDWKSPVRAMTEARGMTFLGAALVNDFAECLVAVRGCGLVNKPAIEAVWREVEDSIQCPIASEASE